MRLARLVVTIKFVPLAIVTTNVRVPPKEPAFATPCDTGLDISPNIVCLVPKSSIGIVFA